MKNLLLFALSVVSVSASASEKFNFCSGKGIDFNSRSKSYSVAFRVREDQKTISVTMGGSSAFSSTSTLHSIYQIDDVEEIKGWGTKYFGHRIQGETQIRGDDLINVSIPSREHYEDEAGAYQWGEMFLNYDSTEYSTNRFDEGVFMNLKCMHVI